LFGTTVTTNRVEIELLQVWDYLCSRRGMPRDAAAWHVFMWIGRGTRSELGGSASGQGEVFWKRAWDEEEIWGEGRQGKAR
jgi:hypothetical protein